MTNATCKLAASAALIAGFFAAPALAAELDWDSDKDGVMNSEEFTQGVDGGGSYYFLDKDGDGNVTRAEYNTGNFERYDADKSGDLNDDEMESVYFDGRPEGPLGNKQLKR